MTTVATISADIGKCQGYANCMVQAPDHFDLDDDGKVEIVNDAPSDIELDEVRAAVDSCPVRALALSS
ncbi:MAG: ferredoxin [Aeromicrobium sp.]